METEDPSSNCQQGTDSAGLYSLIVFNSDKKVLVGLAEGR